MADNTYSSHSGTDIHAVFGNTIFGEIQMVSYKSDREKAPVYTMGSADPRSFARGKRLVTGACVFVVFDRDSLLEALNESNGDNKPHLDKNFTANLDAVKDGSSPAGGSIRGEDEFTSGFKFNEQTDAQLADQLLPFDITLVGANEYGRTSKMIIHGVELMSEAGGVSINDLVIEKQMSFVAKYISPWTVVE